jgi:hypothetical protein
MPADLLAEVAAAAADTGLSKQDVIRQSTKLGLQQLRASLAAKVGRVTNVDPLPDKVLDRIYSKREEEDEAGVKRFVKAQSFGGPD